MRMTFPISSLPSPLERSTRSSAWSQGTLRSETVTFPCHVVGDHDVLLGDVGDEPQEVPDLDVVEVEGDAAAGVAAGLGRAGGGVARGLGGEARPPRRCRTRPGRAARRLPGPGPGRARRLRRSSRTSPSGRSTTRSVAVPRRLATIRTCPVEGWLKEETICTGPLKAAGVERALLRARQLGALQRQDHGARVGAGDREGRLAGELDAGVRPPARRRSGPRRCGRGAASGAAFSAATGAGGAAAGSRAGAAGAAAGTGAAAGQGGGGDQQPALHALHLARWGARRRRRAPRGPCRRPVPKRTWENGAAERDRAARRAGDAGEVERQPRRDRGARGPRPARPRRRWRAARRRPAARTAVTRLGGAGAGAGLVDPPAHHVVVAGRRGGVGRGRLGRTRRGAAPGSAAGAAATGAGGTGGAAVGAAAGAAGVAGRAPAPPPRRRAGPPRSGGGPSSVTITRPTELRSSWYWAVRDRDDARLAHRAGRGQGGDVARRPGR